jgi:hypothetical protein
MLVAVIILFYYVAIGFPFLIFLISLQILGIYLISERHYKNNLQMTINSQQT